MKLHSYQEVGVAHLQANPRAGLMLDMGLGKTAVVLAALRPRDLPALVVAPKRVAEEVWDVECELWRPDLRLGKAVGTPAQRERVLRDRSLDVVVISRDNLRDRALAAREWTTFVIDELSGFKKWGGARWKAAKRIIARGGVENVWGLTGTPAPNGLEQLWPQMYLLDNGYRLGRTFSVYRERHFQVTHTLPNGHHIRRVKPGHDKMIHAEIEDICLSMETEGRIELPPVTWNTVQVPLPANVMKLYHHMSDALVADMAELGFSSDMVMTADTAAALSNRLSQITAGFLYEDAEDARGRTQRVEHIHDERLRAVEEILDGTGSPTLVAYRYRPELEALKKRFGKDLHTPDDPDVFKRWNAGKVPILAAHPASIGHGLNLQHGGFTAIWMSPTWDLELWDQFNKRLIRQGQKHPVIIHMLCCPGTIDERIYKTVRGEKTAVQGALLDHLESPV